jgi:hypothetical protein
MADENEVKPDAAKTLDPNETPSKEADSEDELAAVAASDTDDASDEGEGEGHPRSPDDPDALIRDVLRRHNTSVVGHLMLHYASRDVSIPFDGASALRVLDAYRRRADVEQSALGDRLSVVSDASAGWLVVDIADPALLATSWMPLGNLPDRMAIDPPAAVTR